MMCAKTLLCSADLDLEYGEAERSDPERDLEREETDDDEDEEVIEYNDETDDTSIGGSLEERQEDLGSPGSLQEICNDDHDLALPKNYPKASTV